MTDRPQGRARGVRANGPPHQRPTAPPASDPLPPAVDLVPLVLSAAEWAVVERGVVQRVLAVEAFLADVHGPGRALRDGVVPRRAVTSSARFDRDAAGVEPPGGVRVHAAAVDLVRGEDGVLRVWADDVRAPGGAGRVLSHRAAMARAVPGPLAELRVRPVSAYPRRLLAALRATAPEGVDDPTVVVLTPGPDHPGHGEHAQLARAMGVELAEGGDLLCRGGRVHLRTTAGLRPVHVVHRWVHDADLDPAHAGTASGRGCAGLVAAARAGGVTIANAVGSGLAEDPVVRGHLPDLVRYYLAEEPVLADVPVWRLDEPAARAEVLDRLDEVVLQPVAGGAATGPAATPVQRAAARTAVLADPRAWVARPALRRATAPVLRDGRMVPGQVDLRCFAVHDGARVWVLPGGLGRVAPVPGEPPAGEFAADATKDAWVLEAPARAQQLVLPETALTSPASGARSVPLRRGAPC